MDEIGKSVINPYGVTPYTSTTFISQGRAKENTIIPEQKDIASISGKSGKSSEEADDRKTGTKPEEEKRKPRPEEVTIRYVCSKGDVEFHTAKDSDAGVRAHEERHISDYYKIAARHGLEIVSPDIVIYHTYSPDLEMYIATGGLASCSFATEIGGNRVGIPITRDGEIADSTLAKQIEEEKKRK